MANDNEIQQGASYPYVPLSSALVIAEAVKSLGGNRTFVPKSLLASTLKQNEKSQTFTFQIAAAKCFGMIEGRSSYVLTENAKRYFFPTSDNDVTKASLSFLASPSGFAEIIKRFDGQKLPETKMLANIFHTQLRVPESWSVRAAQFFTSSAQTVGVVDEQRFLRFGATRHLNGRVHDTKPESTTTQANIPNVETEHVESEEVKVMDGYHSYILPLPNNRKVTVIAPLDITPQEIKRLVKWEEFTLQVDWGGEENKTA